MKSNFAKRLAADPELKKRVDEFIKRAREGASEELQAIREAERITAADLSVIINARADEMP